jgi:hypothetical protein
MTTVYQCNLIQGPAMHKPEVRPWRPDVASPAWLPALRPAPCPAREPVVRAGCSRCVVTRETGGRLPGQHQPQAQARMAPSYYQLSYYRPGPAPARYSAQPNARPKTKLRCSVGPWYGMEGAAPATFNINWKLGALRTSALVQLCTSVHSALVHQCPCAPVHVCTSALVH